MKNYFDFIMYLAFEALLIYENKRSLTIDQLHDYRVKLIQKHIEYFDSFTEFDDKEFEKKLHEMHKLNINMSMEEEARNYFSFINDNNEFFSYQDGIISLREGIPFKKIQYAKFDLDSYSDTDDKIICGTFIAFDDCIECLDILGAKKISNYVYQIIADEKTIEKAYQMYKGNELKQNIKQIQAYINYRLSMIGNLKDDKMRCYHRAINAHGNIDPEEEGEDIWLLSDYLMEKDKFYNLYERHVNNILSNKYQRAIFDTGTLVYDKLGDIMSAIWDYRNPNAKAEIEPVDPEATSLLIEEHMAKAMEYEDEFEDNQIDIPDDFEEEDMNLIELYLHTNKINMTFYLNYINHINQFLETFDIDPTLEDSKNRLLYLLDGYEDNLYEEQNFKNALANYTMADINYKEDFDDFYIVSRLFLIDILEGLVDDNMTLRKILFISTYYDLTKDKRIKKIINKYKKTELGAQMATIILEHNHNQLNSLLTKKTRKLIKKKTDEEN